MRIGESRGLSFQTAAPSAARKAPAAKLASPERKCKNGVVDVSVVNTCSLSCSSCATYGGGHLPSVGVFVAPFLSISSYEVIFAISSRNYDIIGICS